jgi:hypothetical protein
MDDRASQPHHAIEVQISPERQGIGIADAAILTTAHTTGKFIDGQQAQIDTLVGKRPAY